MSHCRTAKNLFGLGRNLHCVMWSTRDENVCKLNIKRLYLAYFNLTTELDFVVSRSFIFFLFVGRSSSRPSPHHGTKSVEAIIDNTWRGTNSNTLDNKVWKWKDQTKITKDSINLISVLRLLYLLECISLKISNILQKREYTLDLW